MRFNRWMLGRAGAFMLLAGVMPANVEAATAERAPARADRLLTPLGAGGATDPIASAMRKAERQIQNSLRLQEATGSATPLLVGKRGSMSEPFDAPEPERPRKLIAVTAWSPLDATVPQAPKHDGQPLVVLAAVDHGPRPARPGERPRLSDAQRLPWAETPMLPPLLSEPGEPSAPAEIKRLVDPLAPPVPRRERELPPQAGVAQPVLSFASPARSRSIPDKTAHTVRVEAPRLSLPGIAALPSLDPLAEPQALPSRAFIMPFENGFVSSLYNQGRAHPAIDLAGKMGAPVFATSGGQKVIFAAARGGYGNAVITRDAEGREHLYGHLSAINTRVGVTLGQGDRLGALGSTGFSTGPHVHYEVKDRKGAHINPVTLLFPDRRVANGFRWAGTVLPPTGGATATAQASFR